MADVLNLDTPSFLTHGTTYLRRRIIFHSRGCCFHPFVSIWLLRFYNKRGFSSFYSFTSSLILFLLHGKMHQVTSTGACADASSDFAEFLPDFSVTSQVPAPQALSSFFTRYFGFFFTHADRQHLSFLRLLTKIYVTASEKSQWTSKPVRLDRLLLRQHHLQLALG